MDDIGTTERDTSEAAPGPIYLDCAAHTPLDARVLASMVRTELECLGNPHSTAHAHGRKARDAVEAARRELALTLGAEPGQLLFTSGATESNNLALLGTCRAGTEGVVTCTTEHASVLEPLAWLERQGTSVVRVPVDAHGRLDPERLLAAVRPETRLVSLMWVNNELGTIHPIAELAAALRERGVLFHVDAAQAFGRVPIGLADGCIDLMTISAHKAGGPAGVGALFVRDPARLLPRLRGGGQEAGLRSGSLPTALCVGFGVIAAVLREELEADAVRLAKATTWLRAQLGQRAGPLRFFTPPTQAAPGILCVGFEGVAAEDVMALVSDDLAISAGSACTTGSGKPSHVLEALPVPPELRRSALRLSPGRRTTDAELARTVEILAAAVELLRRLGPRSAEARGLPDRITLTAPTGAPSLAT
ncbi:MAG: cysteine desulfurase [Deltaproteobacteria bacterium]|nr:cysteine desulfurase [Deltaproteobacteria bacterium]